MQTQAQRTNSGNNSRLTANFSSSTDSSSRSSTTQLLRSRSTLLSYVLKLNKSIDAHHADLAQAINQRFVQVLTDYISYGHFRLLNRCLPEAHQIVALQNNTQILLTYTERYATSVAPDLYALKADLEQLALTLEVRFEIEDEMVVNLIWQ